MNLAHRLTVLLGALTTLILSGCWLHAQEGTEREDLQALLRKGDACSKEAHPAEAVQHYERAVTLAERVHGPEDPETATVLNKLAEAYRALGRYSQAEPLYQRSLQIREDRLGKDHPAVAASLNNLALLRYQKGQYEEAKTLLQRSLQIREDKLGKDHLDVAISLNNLAEVHLILGELDEAEGLLRRSLEIREEKLGKDHPLVAFALNSLASLDYDRGQYAQAVPLVRRGLQIRENKLGKDHPLVAVSLESLASLYTQMGQYTEAEELRRRALQIREDKLGKDHPEVALSLNNLGLLYERMGKHKQAESLLQRALQIREDKLGKNHPDVATTLNNLALVYRDMNDYERAEPLYQRSLQICEDRLGQDHSRVGTSLNNLAEFYVALGQDAKAEPLLRRSLHIWEARLGKDHPLVALSHDALARLFTVQQKWDEAATATDQARHLLRRHVARVLPALSESEQLTFLRTLQDRSLHAALSLGLLRREDAEMAARSAAWLLNGKALAQESLAERALLARDRSDPRLADLSQQLLDTRKRLAALTLAPARSGQEETRRQRLQRLSDQEQELSRRLNQVRGGPDREDPWVELSAVRQVLPANAVLIDLARFNIRNFEARGKERPWLPAHYAAWVIPTQGQGTVRLIDLGPAERIDAAVQAVRDGVRAAQGSREHPSTIQELGEPEAEQELRKPLAALSKLVLQPLAEYIDGTERWIISPDASLWLVPWAALPLADGSYAIEKHQISYAVSGRDLISTAPAGKPGRSMILADPDYDLGMDKARRETQELITRSGSLAELRGLTVSFRLPPVPRLPGTAAEAQAVAPKLQRYAQQEPQLLTGAQALEGVVKAVHQPRVLVLSTHGFFLPEQEVAPTDTPAGDEKHAALTKEGKALENPLLRCGLLLAGCNNRDQAQERDEDGVLTGLEIVGTDLRGTDLVVLSACETGLGEVHNGEGVAGLRQAFQLAGARSVVATLWQIPDRDSARLMSDFFANLADGKGKADALRDAQLALIQAHRDRKGAAHPFFWAAFTLTGD